jgi:hypothetical protein
MTTPNVTLRLATLADLDAVEQRFDSAAELAAAKRVGFQVEGPIRRAQWRGGTWHDQRLLSLLRDEWRGSR